MRLMDWFRGVRPVPTVRPARQVDAWDMARIHASGFARPWPLIEFEEMIANERTEALVATVAYPVPGQVGFIIVRAVTDEAEILTIAVEPDWQGRGIGRQLIDAAADTLIRRGVASWFLEVEEENAPARRLYAHAGFEEIARREAYYRKPDNTTAAALIMRRTLR